jgi:hypothetical protein
MDPISTLATSAVAVLAPYLAEAGKEFAKEAGKTAAGKIEALYTALKNRFKKKSSGKEALSDLEANPDNEDAKAALRLQLTKQMSGDPTFADSLRQILAEINQDKASQSFLVQVYGGEVGQIINAGHIDSISYTPPSKQKKESKRR